MGTELSILRPGLVNQSQELYLYIAFLLSLFLLIHLSIYLSCYPSHIFPFLQTHASAYLPTHFTPISALPQMLPYSRATTKVSSRFYLLFDILTHFVPSLCYFMGINILPYSSLVLPYSCVVTESLVFHSATTHYLFYQVIEPHLPHS